MIDAVIYSERERVVRVTLSGSFSVDDFGQAMGEVVRIRQTVGPTHAIWDVRALDFSQIDIHVLRQTSQVRAAFAPRREQERVAVIASGEIEQSIAKLFLDLSEDPATAQRVFTDRAAAERWCLTGEAAG